MFCLMTSYQFNEMVNNVPCKDDFSKLTIIIRHPLKRTIEISNKMRPIVKSLKEGMFRRKLESVLSASGTFPSEV